MDGIVLFKIFLAIILQYFEVILQTLQQYFMIIKLCNCMFLGPYQELIEVEICNEINTLEEPNQTTFYSLEPPITFSDLPMLLGMFRFYALWIPLFQVGVLPWKSLLKQGHGEVVGEALQSYIICELWDNEDSTLLYNIKKGVVAGPILACTKFIRRM